MMYMQALQHLRDFMTEEELKFLPGRLQSGTFMLLTQSKGGEKESGTVWHQVLQVFTSDGTWIGEITNPDWIPNRHTL